MGFSKLKRSSLAYHFTRRGFLGLGALATASLAFSRSAFSSVAQSRSLKLHNLHTGEQLATTYWADGSYIPGALGEIRKVLRDHRSGDQHDMDVNLLDLLAELRGKLETSEPFHVISGYRSPKTNGLMAKASHGVAKHSLHMVGKAIDIRVPGRDLARVHKAALALKRGGVGYYPASDFVHVDVGKLRQWSQRRAA